MLKYHIISMVNTKQMNTIGGNQSNISSEKLEERSPGCFYYNSKNTTDIDNLIIDELLFLLESKDLKLGRICLHKENSDLIQAMIIALHHDYEVKTHVHNGPEYLKIIRGELIISEYTNGGNKLDHVLNPNSLILLGLSEGVKHSVKSKSNWSVFLEVGLGPFNKNKTIYL